MAEVAAVVGVVGTVMSIAGQRSASSAQQDAYNQQAEQHRRNAIRAKQQAKFNADLHELQTDKAIASTEAAFAAAGVEGGSVETVIQDSVFNAEIDRQNILAGGDIRARSFINQAAGAHSSAASIGAGSTMRTIGAAFTGASRILPMVGGGGGTPIASTPSSGGGGGSMNFAL